jgi:hypothetical protein
VGGQPSNERLEFLGDAVLGMVVADLAYRHHGELAEGKLTDLRKSVVNASALAEVALEIGLGAYLRLGKGEDAAGGRSKPSILSDAFEAVLGEDAKVMQAALWPSSSQCFRWHAAPQYAASLQRAHFFAPFLPHIMQICGGSAPRANSSDATAK